MTEPVELPDIDDDVDEDDEGADGGLIDEPAGE